MESENDNIKQAQSSARKASLDWKRIDAAILLIKQKHIAHYGSLNKWQVRTGWRIAVATNSIAKWQRHQVYPRQKSIDQLVDMSFLDNPFGTKIK